MVEEMTSDPVFVEGYIDETYWNWKYQYQSSDWLTTKEHQELYDWCLDNLGANIDWHVKNNGVIIRKEEDAMAFKLRWA